VRLAENVKGLSKLALIILLAIFFLLGAILSYIWTMGFYASSEFQLPSKTNVSIENVQFFAQDATFFNVTVLNPSYSPSVAMIERIKVATIDGKVQSIPSTFPELSFSLAPGRSQTIKCFWNWGNHTDQLVDVYVLVTDGSGPAVEVRTVFMNLTITNVIFEPSVTASHFNVTVASMGSPTSFDISGIFVDEAKATDVTPTLPHTLISNASRTFSINRDWTDLQGKTVSLAVQTTQGFVAYKSVTVPQVKLNISNIVFFNITDSFYFNATIQNSAESAAKVDINNITVYVEGQNITIGIVDPALPQALVPNSTVPLKCTWDWRPFKGKNATVTVDTVQGFKASTETIVPSTP